MAKKAGRKPLYEEWLTPDGLLLIENWIREGRTEEDIARNEMHVRPETLCEWKNRFPQLAKATKKTRAIRDAEIDNAFYRDLKGRYVEEETTEITIHRDAKGNEISRTEHKRKNKRYVQANPSERIFYYKVQRGWRENLNLNIQADVTDGFIEALNGTAAKDWEDDEE